MPQVAQQDYLIIEAESLELQILEQDENAKTQIKDAYFRGNIHDVILRSKVGSAIEEARIINCFNSGHNLYCQFFSGADDKIVSLEITI